MTYLCKKKLDYSLKYINMGKMKEIYMDTLEETEDLTTVELQILVRNKNYELGLNDELVEMMSKEQLVSLIGDKNLLLAGKN